MKRYVGITCYIPKYITKSYLDHQFNRKRYWVHRSIKLPESHGEWMRAQTVAEAVQELYSRFDTCGHGGSNKRRPVHHRGQYADDIFQVFVERNRRLTYAILG